MKTIETTRRQFVLAGGLGVAGALAGGGALAKEAKEKDDDDVPPTEDLMREHGVLRRILLVYGEVIRRVDAKQEIKPECGVGLGHHHPRVHRGLSRAGRGAVHLPPPAEGGKADRSRRRAPGAAPGRTSRHRRRAEARHAGRAQGRRQPQELADKLRAFIRMYEPHAAREDTVLFPAFRALLSERELKKLMDLFEDKEKALPHGGFEKMVDEVAQDRAVARHLRPGQVHPGLTRRRSPGPNRSPTPRRRPLLAPTASRPVAVPLAPTASPPPSHRGPARTAPLGEFRSTGKGPNRAQRPGGEDCLSPAGQCARGRP